MEIVNKFLKFSRDLNNRVKVYAAQHETTMQAVIILAVEQFLERECKK